VSLFGFGLVAVLGFVAYVAILGGSLYAIKIVGEWAEAHLPKPVTVILAIAMVAAWCVFLWVSWEVVTGWTGA